MKTWVVRVGQKDFVGNAETPEEVVLYAIARASLIADEYVVYDHDLNRHVIPYASLRSEDTISESLEPELTPNAAG